VIFSENGNFENSSDISERCPYLMKNVFFVVGPTASGKSELAADVAAELGSEIVSVDAFQIYRGLDLLTAKPGAATLTKAPHHLIGTMSISEEMNVAKYRELALQAIAEIHARGKLALVVGGSGLYVKALTHGLTDLPKSDPALRAQLNELSLDQLGEKLRELDPETARKIDIKNRRRLVRAIEICLLSGKPASGVVAAAVSGGIQPMIATTGVFVFRDREDLYERINQRVEGMFENGVIEEVRAAGAISETAFKMIGLREIQQLLDGKMSISQCIAATQQFTRRYAKRQLTWFRHQTSFEPLNLSLLTHKEARISLKARLASAQGND
jgi:tRNA dimethylallyltransferase